jgi:ferrous iron transport protein B
VLAGSPNAGKTTLFNALTGSRLKTGNWHGVTVTPASAVKNGTNYVDVPGLYALTGLSMEEASAAQAIAQADVIVNVVDSLTLAQNLVLTRQLLALKKPLVLYVTKTKQLQTRGGYINAQKLSAYLGVPVICNDFKALKVLLSGAVPIPQTPSQVSFASAYSGGTFALSKGERLLYNRYFALGFFVAAIVLMFFLAFSPLMPATICKGYIELFFTQTLASLAKRVISNTLLCSLVTQGILGGVGYVIAFVPQIATLYLFLTLLDESGIMSALSFTTDGIFQKVNLSGRAAFSLVSGFGCTAAAVATTRGYFSKSAQRRTVAVLAYIPCSAKLPVFLTFLSPMFKNPFPAVCALYFGGILLSLLISKLMRGRQEELLSEVTPLCIPSLKACSVKLLFYLKGFIIKVTTTVMVFCVVSWALSSFSFTLQAVPLQNSILATLSKVLLPLFAPMGVNSWQLTYALLSGFIAKENIAATVGMLLPNGANLTLAGSLGVACFVLCCPACISAFAASKKEVGLKFTLAYYGLQLLVAFLVGYAANFLVGLFS